MLFWFFISMFYINFTVATKQKSITDRKEKMKGIKEYHHTAGIKSQGGGRKEQENCKTVKTERAKYQG